MFWKNDVGQIFKGAAIAVDFAHQAAGKIVGKKAVRMVLQIGKAGVEQIRHYAGFVKVKGKFDSRQAAQEPKPTAKFARQRSAFAARPRRLPAAKRLNKVLNKNGW